DKLVTGVQTCALPIWPLRRSPAKRAGLRLLFHCAVHPPSTLIAVPVIDAAAGELRNTARSPSSSTVAKRLLGWAASRTSLMTSRSEERRVGDEGADGG